MLSGHSIQDQKLVIKTDCRSVQVKVKQNALREHYAILSTFIKLSFVFKGIMNYTILTNFSTKCLVMCKVYIDVGDIK